MSSPYREPASEESASDLLKKISALKTNPYAVQSAANAGQVAAQIPAPPTIGPSVGGLPGMQVIPKGTGLTNKLSMERGTSSGHKAETQTKSGSSSNSSNEDMNKTGTTQGSTHKVGLLLPGADIDTAEEEYRRRPEAVAAQAGIDTLERQMGMMQKLPVGQDVRPLMAALDSMRGTHQADSTPGVPGIEARNAMISQYLQKIQADKMAQQTAINNYIGKIKSGSDTQTLLNTIAAANTQKQATGQTQGATTINVNTTGQTSKQGAQETATDPDLKSRGGNPAMQALAFARQTDRESKDLRTRGELINTVMRLLNGTPAEQQNIPTLAARIIEGTVRPQLAVIARDGGDPSWLSGIEQRLTKIVNGQITVKNMQEFTNMFKQLSEQHTKDVKATTERWKVTGNKVGLSDEEFQHMVGPQWIDPHASSTDELIKKNPMPGAATVMTPEKIKRMKELQEKYGK